MRASIYNPYLDTMGGGERYVVMFAKILLEKGWTVEIEWCSPEIIKSLESRFGVNLDGLKVVDSIKRGDGYDLCFWVSDGSIPLLKSRKNILHFQVPFTGVNGKSLMNKMKFIRINKIVVNSIFTKNFIDKEFGVDSLVIYPPVDTVNFRQLKKENIILSVGRFSELLQAKHQDILIDSFKKIFDGGIKNWTMVLAGGAEIGDLGFTDKLAELSKYYPVKIVKSPTFKELKLLYGHSRIFWSASGFGEDETKRPEKVEHFGMAVVEAQGAGLVPLIYNAGGHKEIVFDGVNGYLWRQQSELINNTKKLIKDPKLLKKVSLEAISSSGNYSNEKFKENVLKIL